ncbi:alpha/beta-hydrolase [Mycena latifolia]|nr:alpha/beta-hydrolase [Mycena latifolia]
MDAVAQMTATDIPTILFPTIGAFAPLLEPLRAEIAGARKTFKYGDTERHQVDVYSPLPSETKPPVLLFVYGGGFVTGERTLPAPADLGYGNLGLYFSKSGFLTLIPDYRLAPATTFPGPAHDLRAALAWAAANLADTADLGRVYLVGHSAGGVHVLTLLLHEPAPVPGVTVKGTVIASAPYHFGGSAMADGYYGTPESTAANAPLGLLNASFDEVLGSLPPLALVHCARDPPEFVAAHGDFVEALEAKKLGRKDILAEGHNHISLTWALGTGDGEGWAEEVVGWIGGL